MKQDVAEAVSIKNLLLRGCILKNTKHVYGAVISTGADTKVEFGAAKRKWWQVGVSMGVWGEAKNNGAKVAMLTQRTNNVIYCLIAALLVLCVIVGGERGVEDDRGALVVHRHHDGFHSRFLGVLLPLLPAVLPVHPRVTVRDHELHLHLPKRVHAERSSDVTAIRWLQRRYDEVKDEPMRVRSSTLNDDLGQVGYIF